jgi:hypothetical protein
LVIWKRKIKKENYSNAKYFYTLSYLPFSAFSKVGSFSPLIHKGHEDERGLDTIKPSLSPADQGLATIAHGPNPVHYLHL